MYCKGITYGCILFAILVSLWNVSSAKSSTLLNDMHICINIVTFRNTLIQIHKNLFKNYFPLHIVHTKYNTFTVFCSMYILFVIGYQLVFSRSWHQIITQEQICNGFTQGQKPERWVFTDHLGMW